MDPGKRQSAVSAWWRAPFVSSLLASAADTVLFFGLAFAATGLPWVTWAIGDFAVKVAMALVMLIPYWGLRRLVCEAVAGRG